MTTSLGLMSGTSLDGIDAALIRTDGHRTVETGAHLTVAYEPGFRQRLRAVLGGKGDVAAVEQELTDLHAEAVARLLAEAGIGAGDVDLIGFHGHTILHAPHEKRTWQIGDAGRLARRTGIAVVHDFRSADVAAGGQGAPLLPLYHQARAGTLARPLAVLNLGGVGNVTWLGDTETDIVAFDTGPGNALIDDWMLRHTGQPYDEGGALALKGHVIPEVLGRLLEHSYFARPAPKSLDRDDFSASAAEGLAVADGAATLAAFTAETVARSVELMPRAPSRWLVTGGGRHNRAIMRWLNTRLQAPVDPVESVGWSGDALEAQGFAYFAVRSVAGLPISFPGTTGVPAPLTGGRLHRAN